MDATISFKAFWRSTILPFIAGDFERLLNTVPTRIAARKHRKKEKDNGQEAADKKKEERDACLEKINDCVQEVKLKGGERRNAYMHIAFTPPVDNTYLEERISLAKVENMVADMFLKSLPTDGAAETPTDSQDAAGDGAAETAPPRKAARRALSHTGKREWQIPTMVERGFEIPIMITRSWKEPGIGKFTRLGMDIVVNALCLAYFLAKQEGSKEAVTALEVLILDWPFDFILIEGSSDEELEENKFKWSVNMTARVERLRDFVGLENANLLRIVSRAADLAQGLAAVGRKPAPEQVQQWLQTHVTWGAFHCPDIKTVKRHMENWTALRRCPAVLNIIESAANRYGRDNMLDWPTKLGLIVQKTDASSMTFVVESLYARMLRLGQKGPFSTSGLGEVIAEILWGKTYVASMMRKYPEVFNTRCNSDASTTAEEPVSKTAKASIDSPPHVLPSDGGA